MGGRTRLPRDRTVALAPHSGDIILVEGVPEGYDPAAAASAFERQRMLENTAPTRREIMKAFVPVLRCRIGSGSDSNG
jgi:hypothetical protein